MKYLVKNLKFAAFLLAFISFCRAYSTNTLIISKPLEENYDLSSNMVYLVDSTGSLSFDDVSGATFNERFRSFDVVCSTKAHVIWGKIKIHNNTDDFICYSLNVYGKEFELIAAYFMENDRVFKRNLLFTGHLNDLNNKIFIDNQNNLLLYIRFQLKDPVDQIRLSLVNEYLMNVRDEKEKYSKGIFIGLLCMSLIYTVFFFFSLKEKTYLWFGILQVALILFFVDLRTFSDTLTGLDFILNRITASFLIISITMFTSSFLKLKLHYAYWNRIIQMVMALSAFMWLFEPVFKSKAFEWLTALVTVLFFFGILLITAYAAFRKIPFARIFFISTLALLGPLIMLLVQLLYSIESDYFITEFILLSGVAFQIFIWTIMVNYQVSQLRQKSEKQRTDLIHSLEEKERLVSEQNLILDIRVKERTNELQKERKKSEDLLLNILPANVADELKEKGTAEAREFNNVTVMFTDFANFTGISEHMTPKELVHEIHRNFTAFDVIIEKHGIEKIKTIGDAYLAVCGLSEETPDHAHRIIRAALDLQEFVIQSNSKFSLRIGINSGPVVAGIVGVKKFAYDIWGDTVNTASRMESSGEVGKVNISESTYELVKDKFNCIHRGKVTAKGKGEIDMYFINPSLDEG